MRSGMLAAAVCLLVLPPVTGLCQSDWPMYGYDDSSTRFSPLDQINTKNVQNLTRAWTYHLSVATPASQAAGAVGRGGGRRSSEATPIVIKGGMYLPTPYGTIVALDPETGKEIWTYKLDTGRPAQRAVSYWPGDKRTPASILFGTGDGRYISLNAETGKPTAGFGQDGAIDMKPGVDNGFPNARYDTTSPGSIYKDLIITGAQVQESPAQGTAGDIRAWDVHTGKLVWQFHTVPRPGEVGHDTWEGDSWVKRSGTNVWGLMSVDVKRGLVFLPIGSPTSDFYAADRKGNNLFGNSLVAVNANNGKLVWYFQAVHHDTMDYDLESAPILLDVKRNGETIPAVAVTSKTGLMFILDRRNGKPVYGVEERPSPPTDVEGEQTSPTQPFPVKPLPLGRMNFTADEIATVTPEQKKFCTDLMATEGGMLTGGAFSPYKSKLTIVFPGTLGVVNWGGMSFNPKLGYIFVNTNNIADVGKIVKNNEPNPKTEYVRTSPWGLYARFWNNDKFWPCQQPPWGELQAINVNTGDVAWKIPFGTDPELEAKGVHGTGTLNYGGSITTGGGLVFIGATYDHLFHAFDASTGKVLWETKLEAGAYVVPMTYKGKSGKQYVLIVATGGSYYDRTSGDSVVAFALPDASSK